MLNKAQYPLIIFLFILFPVQSFAENYLNFYVKNHIKDLDHDLCAFHFSINNETGRVCTTGGGNYCPWEMLITLKDEGQPVKFNLIEYSCIDKTKKQISYQIDDSCHNQLIPIKPGLTTIHIEEKPTNVMKDETTVFCNVKS